MKKQTLTTIAIIILMITACKKNGTVVTSSYLVSKWTVVVDSIYFPYVGAPKTVKYIGVPGDYFDFRADNKCYIREGNSYDTVSYAIQTDTTVMIQLYGYTGEEGKIKRNSATNISITTSSLANPLNGFSHRTVNLSN